MNDLIKNEVCRSIDAFSVPAFDFAAIKGATAPSHSNRRFPRRKVVLTTLIAVVLPIAAAAAVFFKPLSVTHDYGNWQLHGPTRTYMHPTSAVLASAAQSAPYHVVWPAGLPSGTKIVALGTTGSEVFVLFYTCPNGATYEPNVWAIVIPKQFSAINPELGQWIDSQVSSHRRNLQWIAGNERVLLTADCLTAQQMARVRAATVSTASTPAAGR